MDQSAYRKSHGEPAGEFQHEFQHGHGGSEHRLLSQPVASAVSEHRPGTFTAQDGTQTTCDFMQRSDLFGEAVVTDRYTKSYLQLSAGKMCVVLPKDGVDLDELLSEDTLWEILRTAATSLPR